MLKTVELTEQRNTDGGCAMLLGGFDGLHLGHRRLLVRAKESGLPVGVMTISGGKETESLFTFREREDVFKRAGADFLFELPFAEIKNLSGEDFLKMLVRRFDVKLFVCGEDFRFGAGALGTPALIEQATRVRVEVQSLLEMNGEKVSSTLIKKRLAAGDAAGAALLLQEPFFLLGEVFRDRGIGRTIGFPTANVRYPKEKYPLKIGVYETRIEADGAVYKGITNYGARPTFGEEEILTESYLDGFSGELYGKEIKISFVRFLREVQKFDNPQALRKQLKKDIGSVRGYD